MTREIITVSVGGAAIKLTQRVWQQYCAEHNISYDGIWRDKPKSIKRGPTNIEITDRKFESFFEQNINSKYTPRALMIDIEPDSIDNIAESPLNELFDPNFLLTANDQSANTFARGMYSIGRELIDEFNESIRELMEQCDNFQGFIINHSVGGGTGSGLTALIMERIAVDYRKKMVVAFDIYSKSTMSANIVDPYNSLFSTRWSLDYCNANIVLDNEAIYDLCKHSLDIKTPTYTNMNRLIAKMISGVTAEWRFEWKLTNDHMEDWDSELLPFPRLQFLTTAMAPICSVNKVDEMRCDVQGITESCFLPQNFFVKLIDFDPIDDHDVYSGIIVQYRGDVKPKEGNAAVQWLKSNRKVTNPWVPTGFRIHFNDRCMDVLPDDDIAESYKREISMIGNNLAIIRTLKERLSDKYDLIYSQRAFVHWYTNDGMEEGEFCEAREDLGFLEKDYLDAVSEQVTDVGSDDDSY